MQGDERLLKLQQKLQDGPRYLSDLAEEIIQVEIAENKMKQKEVTNKETIENKERATVIELEKETKQEKANSLGWLISLVNLAVQAKSDEDIQPLLPARYHVFIRSIEGASIRLMPNREIYLEHHEKIEIEGNEYPVFELATCRHCGVCYLVGLIEIENGISYLKQTIEYNIKPQYFLLMNQPVDFEIFNEDDEINFVKEDEKKGKYESYLLCGKCGAIDKENLIVPMCSCNKENYKRILKVPRNDYLRKR